MHSHVCMCTYTLIPRTLSRDEILILVYNLAAFASAWTRYGDDAIVVVPINGLPGCGKSSLPQLLGTAMGDMALFKVSPKNNSSVFQWAALGDRKGAYDPGAPFQSFMVFQDRKGRAGDCVIPADLQHDVLGENRESAYIYVSLYTHTHIHLCILYHTTLSHTLFLITPSLKGNTERVRT